MDSNSVMWTVMCTVHCGDSMMYVVTLFTVSRGLCPGSCVQGPLSRGLCSGACVQGLCPGACVQGSMSVGVLLTHFILDTNLLNLTN